MIIKFSLSAKNNLAIIFILIALPFIFYWPLTLQFFSLKNDALTYYYPIRTLISDALQNGELPLWTPFINLGYPIHADMQSGAWSPVIWIFALLTNYSLAAFQYELIFYIAFAGIGFFFLCKSLGSNTVIAFCAAVSYQFCGFITDSPQFFNCISSACYLPFVFLFFRNLLLTGLFKNAFGFSFSLFLLFTGGYPSIFIICLYVLFFYFIFDFLNANERKKWIRNLAMPIFYSTLLFVIFSLPAILSFVPHLDYIARGKSQSLSLVLENSMNPNTLISFLSPFSITANNQFLDSSILMRSVYVGIVPLIFLIFALFTKEMYKNKENVFFLSAAVITMGMAWGDYFILRQVAYYILPLMDSFRHPATFRLFSIFFLLLFTTRSINIWLKDASGNSNKIKIIINILILIATGIGMLCAINWQNIDFIHLAKTAPVKLLGKLDFSHRYLIQFPFILITLVAVFMAVTKPSKKKWLPFILIFDLFFATQLNMPITVFGSKKMDEMIVELNRNQIKFPIPKQLSIHELSKNTLDSNYVTGSRIPYSKKWGRNDYFITPGNLIIQDSFYYSGIRNSVFENPPIYFADTIISINSNITSVKKNTAYNSNSILNNLSEKENSSDRCEIVSLNANNLKILVNISDERLLVVQQNRYPEWKAFVDNIEVPIVPINISMVGIKVPAGSHAIRLVYKPLYVIIGFYISIVCLGAMMLYFLLTFFGKTKK